MCFFIKWLCKIEKVSYYAKIHGNFGRIDVNALNWVKSCILDILT